MQHDLHCPNCSQHIIVTTDEHRGPVQIQEPVRVTLTLDEIFKITLVVCVSLFMLSAFVFIALIALGVFVSA